MTATPLFFVSHASLDLGLTTAVANAIRAAGGEAFVAEEDHQVGLSLPEKLAEAVRRCDAFVVLLTEGGIESDMVRREVTLAMAERKWIIPLVAPAAQSRVPSLIGLIEWVPFDPEHPASALTGLTGLITRYRDALLAEQMKTVKAEADAEVERSAEQISALQVENQQLRSEEKVLLVGLIILAAFVILSSARGGTAAEST